MLLVMEVGRDEVGGGGQWEGGSATPTPRLLSGSEEFVGVNHATGARQLLLPNR